MFNKSGVLERPWVRVAVVIVSNLLLGQLLALIMSLTGVCTSKLTENNSSFPVLQSLGSYIFIFIVYGPLYLVIRYKYRGRQFANFRFMYRWWRYVILAAIDLEANYCVVMAYQYTDMMSAQLLNCFTLPCCMILSFLLLKVKYGITHVVGAVVAIAGLCLLIALDADGLTRTTTSPKPVLGDMLCVIGSILYATSNVLFEWFIKPGRDTRFISIQSPQPPHRADAAAQCTSASCQPRDDTQAGAGKVKSQAKVFSPASAGQVVEGQELTPEMDISPQEQVNNAATSEARDDIHVHAEKVPAFIPPVENLACMSLAAALISLIQFFAAEWKTFGPHRPQWSSQDWLFQMLFCLAMLAVYTMLPLMFLRASAAFANVSLLSVNIYTIIWNVKIFNVYPTKYMAATYVLTTVGVVIYDMSDSIHMPCCMRWNYPCGKPHLSSDEDENDRVADNEARVRESQEADAMVA